MMVENISLICLNTMESQEIIENVDYFQWH